MSAAKRVAHAAETIRARWERDIASDPQTEAAQVLEDTGQLLDPEAASELAEFRKARELAKAVAGEGALPMPAGPGPQAKARDEFERILREKFSLEDALKVALRDVAGARRERDLIRERVSEPYGCTYCGTAKRVHGRRYLSGVGVHVWERPTDEQVKDRMLARRAARMPLDVEELRSRVAELEAERHSTNEALDDAVQALRLRNTQRGDVEQLIERERQCNEECVDIEAVEAALSLGSDDEPSAPSQALREDELAEAPELTVFRASHDSIVMGLYTTAAEARKHCETLIGRDWPNCNVDWVEDDEDGVAELTVWVGGEERTTGYVVTALEIASEYDEEADE